ncbi:grasp-with-spasm system SPASM domain peptide maturase [Hymenobacter sp. 15J16-1T3B]|uniref:grasp-with-spasm system SPASM domain peptide maturase n=1 Tax=Hymenobacter sp. 15J16-1T3B TaxID=2886941 RepID=UPI001D10DEBE|nr:grasp-with-spasm system SPASM domain peptide maturase [Hymenobacter sp. 15J16-1T3B]MCC3157473.1 grasp-with-spasm system SPASM domain peptide maturase [Hymenobacter sp. 15J16-1T3B]
MLFAKQFAPGNTFEVYFKLFACCLPVRGAQRSVVCDLQRASYDYIPNALQSILEQDHLLSVGEVLNKYPTQHADTILGYFDFLVEKEYGFYTQQPELFPKMSLAYNHPKLITNAILDIGAQSKYNVLRAIALIELTGCEHLQVRSFVALTEGFFQELDQQIKTSRFRSIEIITKHSPGLSEDFCRLLLQQNPRISQIIVHSAPDEKQEFIYNEVSQCLIHARAPIDSEAHCGYIHPALFSIHLSTFTEAQQFNSCLNRKIAVDQFGNVKNCPSHAASYGAVDDQASLLPIAQQKRFQEIWGVSKDQINVCQDCEFRYICTDCRAYVEAGPLSKPAKCTYDPYAAAWQQPQTTMANQSRLVPA